MNKISDFLKKHNTVLLFVLIVLAGFAFRYSIVLRDTARLEQKTGAKFAPYLVESAVMYSYINQFADGKSIAGVDPALPAMKHVKSAEQMSLSLEYAGGWLLKARRFFCGTPPDGVYERSREETGFLRAAFCFYIALSFGFIFLALRFLKVPAVFAALSSLIAVFSAAALGRYTGQDLIKGAFAMPLLTAYIAAAAGAVYGKYKLRKISLVFAFSSAAAAVASWDASQIVIGMLALCEIVRIIFTNQPGRKTRDLWLMTYLALGLCALIIPYNRLHGAFFSPILQFALPAAIILNTIPAKFKRYWRFAVLILLGVWCGVLSWLSPFAGNYSHFAELLQAKLKHGNILPADPAELTFNVRYLWTPELHSATWKMTKMIFPGLIWCLLILWIFYIIRNIIIRKANRRFTAEKVAAWELTRWLILTVAAFIMYAFMARFRDISVLFAVFSVGLFSAILIRRSSGKAWYCIILLILAGTVAVEWHNSRHLQRGYPQGLDKTAELVKYLRQHDLTGKVFLSDMQTSAMLKGYTNASILVQAKYELPEVRSLTEEYIMTFFHGDMEKFVDFCQKNQTDYLLIHVPTITTSWKVPYSYCYVSNTKRLKKNTAAGLLGIGRGSRNFYELPLPENIKNKAGYRLYKFVSSENIKQARELNTAAWEAYYLGNHKAARKLIRKAYRLHPDKDNNYQAYIRICRKLPKSADLPAKKK